MRTEQLSSLTKRCIVATLLNLNVDLRSLKTRAEPQLSTGEAMHKKNSLDSNFIHSRKAASEKYSGVGMPPAM